MSFGLRHLIKSGLSHSLSSVSAIKVHTFVVLPSQCSCSLSLLVHNVRICQYQWSTSRSFFRWDFIFRRVYIDTRYAKFIITTLTCSLMLNSPVADPRIDRRGGGGGVTPIFKIFYIHHRCHLYAQERGWWACSPRKF